MLKKSEYLKPLFSKYYKKAKVYVPKSLPRREFAFVYFGKEEYMHRHIAFNEKEELISHFKKNTPRHVFYSSAYYEYPAASNMNEKTWLGAELIFDIDVDHIDTPCKELHDKWFCLDCGASGWGVPPQACYSCGSEKIKRETWICDTCLSVARDETLKLIDFLINDFGFSKEKMIITFSGHRGFHVHIDEEEILTLDQDSRREISDYIKGVGVDYRFFIPTKSSPYPPYTLDFGAPAWLGRIARALYNLFSSNTLREKLEKAGFSSKKIEKILSIRDEALRRLENVPPDLGYLDKVIDPKSWEKVIQLIVEEEGVKIDERVTIDIKRLIRLPESLHGKTGMKVAVLSYHELEEFDVEKHAVVFPSEEVKIILKNPPKKVLNIDLSHRENFLEVPFYTFVYFLANGAEVERVKT